MSAVATVAINVDARSATAQLRQMQSQSQAAERAVRQLESATKNQNSTSASLAAQLRRLKADYSELQSAASRAAKETGQPFSTDTIAKLRGLSTEIDRVRDLFNGSKAAAQSYRRELDQVAASAASAARGSGLGARLKAGAAAGAGGAAAFSGIPGLSAIAGGALAGGAAGGAAGAVVGGAAAGVLAIGAAAVSTGKDIAIWYSELKRAQIALQGVSSSSLDFKTSIEGLDQLSRRLNVPIGEATQQFTQLRAAMGASGYQANDTLKVFTSLTQANKALGGNNEKLQGILLATSQVFSKGKVSAEELRGQIGERLPGAFADFAKATGRTTQQLDKDLEKGQVSLDDFMKFAEYVGKKYGATADQIAKASEDAGARLQTAWEGLQKAIGPILSSIGAQIQTWATNAINAITDVINALKNAYETWRSSQLGQGTTGMQADISKINQMIATQQSYLRTARGPAEAAIQETIKQLRSTRAEIQGRLDKALNLNMPAAPARTAAQAGVQVGAVVGGGTSGGGGGRSGKTDAERAAEAAREEAERVQQVLRERSAQVEIDEVRFKLQQQLAAEEKAGDTVAAARLRGAQSLIDAQYQYAQLLADPKNKDARLQEMLTAQGIADLIRVQVNTEAEVNNILDARSAEYNRILAAAQLDLQLAKEKDPLKRAELQIDQLLSSEAYQQLQLTDAQVEALRSVLLETEKIKTKTEETIQIFADMSSTFAGTFGSAIDAMLSGTDELGASLQNLGIDLLKSISKMLIMYGIAQALGALGGDDSTGFFSYLAKGFGYTPKRAMGGPVTAGQPYMVGERGPELFVPSSGGTIVPNGQAGGNGVAVTVNVDAKGTQVQGNDQQGNQLGRVISAAVQQELIKQQRPGGLLAAR